jgi:D-alanyl-D-alanine carboxypeptidase/D-alanyl-D-alanine carboxypeptidase (penicillin-binding protein 5/6)
LFQEICSATSLSITVSGQQRNYSNHNRLLKEYDGCIGVKTGFTKKAGRCLVSAAERDGVTLICVTLSAPDDWNDHKKLLDAGFSSVVQTELTPELREFAVKVAGGTQSTVMAKVFGHVSVCLTEEESKKVIQEWHMRAFYYAPVYAGEVLGQVQFYYQGRLIATQLVLACESCMYQQKEEKG